MTGDGFPRRCFQEDRKKNQEEQNDRVPDDWRWFSPTVFPGGLKKQEERKDQYVFGNPAIRIPDIIIVVSAGVGGVAFRSWFYMRYSRGAKLPATLG
ncbi:hypothetical protein NDU88_003048 [Pleurodeles waltl]|uniref:Uncharacterized protein n=1 Tax=Pleurodeles waltl TaxID=8319 RepID=A0AAV7M2T4_PLEWA|nr:hypothetical protein NDU88_003048 [Pleurodeles waltl]